MYKETINFYIRIPQIMYTLNVSTFQSHNLLYKRSSDMIDKMLTKRIQRKTSEKNCNKYNQNKLVNCFPNIR